MGRWEPDAPGRLRDAAMQLFRERGYEQTTVAEIAERAGVTERTFFRHFADKREVLFGGSEQLQAAMVSALAASPKSLSPIEQVGAALDAVAGVLPGRPYARRRQQVIAAHPELRERELIKLSSLSAALAEALRARGVREPSASLAAEAGIAVFKIAFERWITAKRSLGLGDMMRETLGELRDAVNAPGKAARSRV